MVDSAYPYPVLNVPERYRDLPNLKAGAYDAATLRLAIALADVFLLDSVGTSGTITQSQIQNAINASNVTQRLMPPGEVLPYIGSSNSAVVKSSPGNIYAITVSNANANIRYFQVFDQTTTPVLNNVPARSFPVPPDDSLLLLGQDIIGGNGIVFSVGIAWGFSSTRLTYTAATASDCIATVRYA